LITLDVRNNVDIHSTCDALTTIEKITRRNELAQRAFTWS
jgi:hypothetical protein